jgi:hypothetical protein
MNRRNVKHIIVQAKLTIICDINQIGNGKIHLKLPFQDVISIVDSFMWFSINFKWSAAKFRSKVEGFWRGERNATYEHMR